MQIGLYFLAVIATLVLQTHLVFRGISAGWHVDLTLLVVVAGCLQWGERRALAFAFMTGLLHDTLSSDMLGLHAVSKASTAFVVLLLSRNIQAHSLVLSSGLAALAVSLDTVTPALCYFSISCLSIRHDFAGRRFPRMFGRRPHASHSHQPARPHAGPASPNRARTE